MCGTNGNATDAADSDVVPASALAAALVMIATGIAIVISYGCGKKKAWRPEQTFVLHDHNQPSNEGGFEAIPLSTIDGDAESNAASLDEDPVQGLDNGLSETLETSLLSSRN